MRAFYFAGVILTLALTFACTEEPESALSDGSVPDASRNADGTLPAEPLESLPLHCTDGVKNEDESDADCGESCGSNCDAGRKCVQGADCTSGMCRSQVCVEEPAPVICEEQQDIPVEECIALVNLYATTGGDLWADNRGWLESETICGGWIGVECQDGHVSELILGSNNLNGLFPEEVLRLPELAALSLPSNALTGELPAGISSLTKLGRLNLRGNKLTGSIPNSLGELSALRELVLNANDFSGSFPDGLLRITTLQVLSIGNNRIAGTVPSQIQDLKMLRLLDLCDQTGSLQHASYSVGTWMETTPAASDWVADDGSC